MALKIYRAFFGDYLPDRARLKAMNFVDFPARTKALVTVLNNDQGFGQIKGVTRKLGVNYSPVSICVFKRSDRRLLWETKSKADGSYAFRNIALGLDCFVVAFDPNEEYNAVISDKVVAK